MYKFKLILVNVFQFCFLFFLLTGFDYSNSIIPTNEIHNGGPPKDGIPALYDPKFISQYEEFYLKDDDMVLGVLINGDIRAYPIRILNWHELINDVVGGKEILVSYCPLCGTGMVFSSKITNKRFLFGVSGKLYNSDVLFYDRQTDSLWSQIKMEAVTGPMTGQSLELLPAEHIRWKTWKEKYPNTKVLSDETGYKRDYYRNPYRGYSKSERLYFPVSGTDSRLSKKDWILGVIIEGEAKAYSFNKLKKEDEIVADIVGGQEIFISYEQKGNSAVVKDGDGIVIPSIQGYWFAWAAFYPETEVY